MTNKSELVVLTFKSKIEYAVISTPALKYGSDTEKEFRATLVMNDVEASDLRALLKDNGVSLTVINPSNATIMDRIRKSDDGNFRLTLKRNAINSKGNAATITVEDSQGNPIPSTTAIGNGSTANVEFFITTNPKNNQKALKLSALQILDLIPYNKGSHFNKQQGYTIPAAETQNSIHADKF